MRLSFYINYQTVWGQTLHLTGSIPALGNWDPKQALNLHYSEKGRWSVDIDVPVDTLSIEYRYFLRSNGKEIYEDSPDNHSLLLNRNCSSFHLYDSWQDKPEQLFFYSSAFTDVLFARNRFHMHTFGSDSPKIRLKVYAPRVKKDQQLAVTGNQSVLGHWNPDKAIKLSPGRFPEWEAEFDASGLSYPIEYKFILYSTNQPDVYWETGNNRILTFPPLKTGETAIISGLKLREDFPDWKCAGTVIPVFSLRSNDSFGIGDFHDLKKLTDWVRLTGQKIIQILPVNDTTMDHSWMDSYPYNAISIYALHPLYLNLQRMGKLKDPELSEKMIRAQKRLNRKEKIDYNAVDRYKWLFFRNIFAQEGAQTLKSNKFKVFFRQNKDWLIPYAAYSYLRDKHKTSDFRQWGEYAVYDPQKIAGLCDPDLPFHDKIALYYFLQYHLHLQLQDAKAYAQKHEVILKGDIPIGISSTSMEAWTEPQYFNMNAQAGAPPDDFSVTGQNWGFPTYNWNEMEKDDFSWWKKRFRHLSLYFDAYRIDHILGFFRIWEIPKTSVQGLLAWFNPALPFSTEEIRNAGFQFNRELYTQPRINGCFLSNLFGAYAQEVSEKFLIRISPQYFTLHPDIDTQIKIRDYFSGKEDFKSETLKNALYAVSSEVLFIPDAKHPEHYHPRISAGQTFAYQELSQSDKYAFDYLYWNYFYHRHNDFWKEQALHKLAPLVSSTRMLVCGEDLGMIPHCVPEVMDQLQIVSLEIERMPKQVNVEFERLTEIPYRSVCMTSTHDMSTVRGWWEEDPEKTQRYYNHVLQRPGTAPSVCTPEICREIIKNHLESPAMLVILPLQDWMGMDEKIRHKKVNDERINIPSKPRHYWRYRMHLTIEEMLMSKNWNAKIREMIKESQRE